MASSSSLSSSSSSSTTTTKKRGRIAKYHRIRAHVNPFSDRRFRWCPYDPSEVDYDTLYPNRSSRDTLKNKLVTMADVGCGYGGLTVALGKQYPDELVLGMEIRPKVVAYVRQRIALLQRMQNEEQEEKEKGKEEVQEKEKEKGREEEKSVAPVQDDNDVNDDVARIEGNVDNISVEIVNVMKYLPCYVAKGQLTKLFFLFPDPHFKKKKHSWRIISTNLLAEYAYALQIGGILYTITDVLDLHQWMTKHLDAHPLFERLSQAEMDADPCTPLVCSSSEEANKVEKSSGDKYPAFYRRIADPLL